VLASAGWPRHTALSLTSPSVDGLNPTVPSIQRQLAGFCSPVGFAVGSGLTPALPQPQRATGEAGLMPPARQAEASSLSRATGIWSTGSQRRARAGPSNAEC